MKAKSIAVHAAAFLLLSRAASAAAAVSPSLSQLISEFPEMGFVLEDKNQAIMCLEPYQRLTHCHVQCLENFSAGLHPGKVRQELFYALAELMREVPSSPRFLAEYSIKESRAGPALNASGLLRLGRELLHASGCGRTRAVKVPASQVEASTSAMSRAVDLSPAVKDPDAVFDGKRSGASMFAGNHVPGRGAPIQVSLSKRQNSIVDERDRAKAVSARKKSAAPAPLPPIQMPTDYESDKFLENLVNVRAARAYWARQNVPVVSSVMGAFAGLIQFAQDDAAVMGYYGPTSKQGLKAAADFSVNALSMLMTVPAFSRGVTQGIANVAAKTATNTTRVLGNYKLVARFHAVPGLPYTNAEPIWIGIEKVVQGTSQGRGIVHLGVSVSQGGAHVGLNFLGETHIYMSHMYIKALNIEVPSIIIKFVSKSLLTKDKRDHSEPHKRDDDQLAFSSSGASGQAKLSGGPSRHVP